MLGCIFIITLFHERGNFVRNFQVTQHGNAEPGYDSDDQTDAK